MKLLVGLGNPGPEYEETRHNAGFWLARRFAASKGARLSHERGFFGDIAKVPGGLVVLPQTFMNRSGQAVGAVARFYKIVPEDIFVAHDELDLLPGDVKMKKGGGHAGHNGLRDIIAALGTPDFWRIRIGIGHPRTLNLKQEVVDFVLHPPRRDELPPIEEAIERALGVLPRAWDGDVAGAVMALHSAR